jgi:enoyl-[acyl-carrier protein] reductase III
MQKRNEKSHEWALVLGASSGFGGATAVELSKNGYNIIGIHLDRNATLPNVHKIIKSIESNGQIADFYNMNAADQFQRNEVLDEIQYKMKGNDAFNIKVLIHSLAFGSLRPLIGTQTNDSLTQSQMEMTLDVMAHSLVYWTQGLIFRNLMKNNARIFAITSSGNKSVIPAYGAISAAKAALESHVRQLAMELGPKNISVNAILAGVTDTPALRKIPNSDKMVEIAIRKNPRKRLTTPNDIAKSIAVLCNDNAGWINGGVIYADGGETMVNYIGQ